MPRPITFDPDQVLQTAARVFYEQGFANTGIADIVARAGVSRHSIYTRWGDKEGLLAACLPVYRAFVFQTVLAPLEASPGHQGVYDFLDSLAGGCQASAMPACLLVQSLIEHPSGSGPSGLAKQHFDGIAARVSQSVANSQSLGTLQADFDGQGYGQLVSLTLQGLNVSRRGGLDLEQTRAALAMLKNLLCSQELPCASH